MTKNDLRANEKRWRRKRLFRKRRRHPIVRIFILLLILCIVAVLAWWLKLPPFDQLFEQLTQ